VDDFESRLGTAIRLAGESVIAPESLPDRVRETSARPSRAHAIRTAAVASLVIAVTLSTVGLVVASNGHVTPPPTVPVGSYTNDPSMSGVLQTISCASPAQCVAGGLTSGAKSFAAVEEGSTWVPQRTPNPKGARYVLIDGVSCPGSDACMAVGISSTLGPGKPLKPWTRVTPRPFAQWWNGKVWTLREVPLPSNGQGWLNGVACPSANRCVAVGSGSLIDSWNGVRWAADNLPANQPTGLDLYGVSCSTTTSCTAVGWEQRAGGGVLGVIEELAGGRWRTTTLPNAALSSVSCVSAQQCVAVGYLELSSGGGVGPGGEATGVQIVQTEALVESWNGHEWTRSILPGKLASRGILNGTEVVGGVAVYTNGLQQVSCRATTCVAVGFEGSNPFAIVRTGGAWSKTSAPPARPGEPTFLLSVSCQAATSCTATGFAEAAAGEDNDVEAVIEHWNGQRWTLTFAAGSSAG
jgi:hypothetical protein